MQVTFHCLSTKSASGPLPRKYANRSFKPLCCRVCAFGIPLGYKLYCKPQVPKFQEFRPPSSNVEAAALCRGHMTSHPPFQLPAQVSNRTHPHTSNPLCSICNKFVSLESAKTDEHGRATHENCYFLKLNLNHRVPTGLDRLWRDDEGQDIAE